eukprot:7537796-Alexandrium_andersonii.AAC.1
MPPISPCGRKGRRLAPPRRRRQRRKPCLTNGRILFLCCPGEPRARPAGPRKRWQRCRRRSTRHRRIRGRLSGP